MARPILANAFETLRMAPESSDRDVLKRASTMSADPKGAGVDAAEAAEITARLRDRYWRRLERLFWIDGSLPRWREAARLLRQSLSARPAPNAAGAAHAAIQELVGTRAQVRRAAAGAPLFRTGAWMRAVVRDVPLLALDAHAQAGRDFLDAGDAEGARAQAAAIAESPLADATARQRALAALFVRELKPVGETLARAEDAHAASLAETGPLPARLESARRIVEFARKEVEQAGARAGAVHPAAGVLVGDALARFLRTAALEAAHAGGSPSQAGNDLQVAARTASPGLKNEIEREAADPEAAIELDAALKLCRKGRPQKAWNRVSTLRRQWKDPRRRAWIDELRATPCRWLGPAPKRQPVRLSLFGFGLGFAGKRRFGTRGEFTSSYGLLVMGLSTVTTSVWLRRSVPGDLVDRGPVSIGRVPLRFHPSQVVALVVRAAALLGLLSAAALAGEWWVNQQDHLVVNAATAALSADDFRTVAAEMAQGSGEASPVIRWRRDRLLRAWTRKEIALIRTPSNAHKFLKRIRSVIGDERPIEKQDRPPQLVSFAAPPPRFDWIGSDLQQELLDCAARLQVTSLPSGGGPAWSREVEPWNREALWTADFVSWVASALSPDWSRRGEFLLSMARRFDSPHMWDMVVDWGEVTGEVSPEAVRRLGGHLESARYSEWGSHFRTYLAHADSRDAERILDARARGLWIGVDPGTELNGISALFPPPIRSLVETGTSQGDANALSPERRKILELGVRYRASMNRLKELADTLDPRQAMDLEAEIAALARELPESEDLLHVQCLILLFMGRLDRVIEIAESSAYRGRDGDLARAYLSAGRFDDALELLRSGTRRNLPRLRALQAEWRKALDSQVALIQEELGERELDPSDLRHVRQRDLGPSDRSRTEWIHAKAFWSAELSVWRLRWLRESETVDEVSRFAELLIATSIRFKDRQDDLRLAVTLLEELVSWLAVSAFREEQTMLDCTRILSFGKSFERIGHDLARAGLDRHLGVIARILQRADRTSDAASCFARAWECAPQDRKRQWALSGLVLASTNEERTQWMIRAGGWARDAVEGVQEVTALASSGHWKEALKAVEKLHGLYAGSGDSSTEPAAGALAMFAWIVGGERRWLDAAALSARAAGSAGLPGDPDHLRLQIRIYFARADVDLSGASLDARLAHGSHELDWLEFADLSGRLDDLRRHARESEDLESALRAASRLLELVPGDREALTAFAHCALLRGEPALVPKPAPPPQVDPGVAGHTMPGAAQPAILPVTQQALDLIDRALEAEELSASPRTRACLLVRRALVRAGLGREDTDALLELTEVDLVDSLEIQTSARALDGLLVIRCLRYTREQRAEGFWRPATAAALGGAPLHALAVRAATIPEEARALRALPGFQPLAALAHRRLDFAGRTPSLQAYAALLVAADPRSTDAAQLLRGDAAALEIWCAIADLAPADGDLACRKWLALDVLKGREAAQEFARESQLKEMFDALQAK